MAVILLILKIIGILLLTVLGVILAVVLAVLLVPIRYQAEGSWYGELKAAASVSWLFHIISFRVVYKEHPEVVFCIFGFRIGAEGKQKKKKRQKKKLKKKKQKPEESGQKDWKEDDAAVPKPDERLHQIPEERTDEILEERADPIPEERVNPIPGERLDQMPAELPQPEQHSEENRKRRFSIHGFCDKLKSVFRRIRQLLNNIKDRLMRIPHMAEQGKKAVRKIFLRFAELGRKKEKLIAFLQDEKNQKTLKLLKRQIFAILKHLLPRRMKGTIRFGFDDPYTTGQVLMYAAPFYGLYAGKLELIPVFEEPALDGELYLKGRLRIGTVLVLAARMMLDRNFRYLLEKWRKG